VQSHRVSLETWLLRCKNKTCNREVGLGMVFYALDNPRKARRMRPPDTTFPERDTMVYSNGDPVHQVR
jgi:hypothetical protein